MKKKVIIPESLKPMYDLGEIDNELDGIYTTGVSESDIGKYMSAYYSDTETVMNRPFELNMLYRNVFENALSTVRPTDIKITLELGCGKGYATYAIADLIPATKIIASELSIAMLLSHRGTGLANFQQYENRIIRCQVNADDKTFRDSCFDLVVGTGILHHVFRPLQVIKEVGRVLKPNGVAIFIEPFEGGFSLLQIAYEILLLKHEQNNFILNDQQRDYLSFYVEMWKKLKVDAPHEENVISGLDDKWIFSYDYFDETARIAGFDAVHKSPLLSPTNHVYELYKAHTIGNGIELPPEADEIIYLIQRSFSSRQLTMLHGDGILVLQKQSISTNQIDQVESDMGTRRMLKRILKAISPTYRKVDAIHDILISQKKVL